MRGLYILISRNVAERSPSGIFQRNYIAQIEEIIKQKNDSLHYARTLQDAIIPSKSRLGNILPQSFIFHEAKDIVSGDFCWFEEVGDTVYVAAADCTGHGVPGAMLTMMCSGFLTSAVKGLGIKDTGKILDIVKTLVMNAFSRSDVEMKDGMDISLCAINKKTHEVQWSGANNPLLYFHDSKLHEIDADKQPVGSYEKNEPFTTHTMQLNKGDVLYLFTDGYADQFGGNNGKKFMYKQMKQVLSEIATADMPNQKGQLQSIFENWKGGLEQIDDVLVIGIKL